MQNPELAAVPSIRSAWPGIEGAKYAGIAAGIDGQPDHHLILLADKPPLLLMTWAEAMDWAESVGGVLPMSDEAALLYAHVRGECAKDWHWTATHYAQLVWAQDFDDGQTATCHKDKTCHTRAVLRLPIQSFNPSTESISVIEGDVQIIGGMV